MKNGSQIKGIQSIYIIMAIGLTLISFRPIDNPGLQIGQGDT